MISGSWPDGRYSSGVAGVHELPAAALGELAHDVEEVQPHAADQHRFLRRDGGPVDVGRDGRRKVAQAQLAGRRLQLRAARG